MNSLKFKLSPIVKLAAKMDKIVSDNFIVLTNLLKLQ